MGKKIVGCVCDDRTKAPIADASLFAVDCSGRMLNMTPTEPTSGAFSVSVPDAAGFVVVKATGYQPLMVKASLLQNGGSIPLTKGEGLPVKIIDEPGGQAPGGISWFAWLLIASGVLGYFISREGDKQAKISGNGWVVPVVVLGGAGVLFWYLYNNGGLSALFPNNGNTDNNASVNNAAVNSATASLKQQADAGLTATMDVSQAATIANEIFNFAMQAASGITGNISDNDQNTIVGYVADNCFVLSDVLLLIQQFGTKKVSGSLLSLCTLTGYDCQALDLGSFLNSALDAAHIASLNSKLAASNINYQF